MITHASVTAKVNSGQPLNKEEEMYYLTQILHLPIDDAATVIKAKREKTKKNKYR